MARKPLKESAVPAAALAAALSCSGGPAQKDQTIDRGQEATDDIRKPIGNVAYAATVDSGISDGAMPKNPVYATIVFPKVDALEVFSPSNPEDPADYPYQFEVVQTEDATVFETYVEYGEGTGVMLRPLKQIGVDADGLAVYDEEAGPWTTFTIEAAAQKFGSTDQIRFGDKDVIYSLSGVSKTTLKLGDNTLQGPAADDFIDGEMQRMRYGVLETEEDMMVDFEFAGCEKVYLMQYGKIECQSDSFSVLCKAGMPVGICAVTESGETVDLVLTPSMSAEE